jgi:DNA polymerase
MRFLAKARVLGLGYGCGPAKFQAVAKILAGLDITEEESERIVREYRASNPKILALWKHYERFLKMATDPNDKTLEIPLPSGRELIYRDVHRKGRSEIVAKVPRHGALMEVKLYGGLLAENATQAFARDVFMNRCCALEDAGYEILMRIHDEVVLLVDEDKSEDLREDVERLMSIPPSWCADLPLGAEAIISKNYRK